MAVDLDRESFVARFGGIFEHSPWVAERAWPAGPFASDDALHAAMVAVVDAATPEERLALLRAHPDLGERAGLTAASAQEQAAAGLDALTVDGRAELLRRNAAYRERFGFPFILCAREHTAASILAVLRERAGNPPRVEERTALAEVAKIARLRLGLPLAPEPR